MSKTKKPKTALEEVATHATEFEQIDPPAGPITNCPYCGHNVLEEIEDSVLGNHRCQKCKKQFSVSSGVGGVRHLRSFIVLTQKGPKLVIGPQHLEHLLETDEMEIPAAGWFGDALVGPAHALSMGKIPYLELEDTGITIEDMDVILITSSVWHHKQYAKTSGYYLHYHPDAIFSEIRKADVFIGTKLGLELDVEQKQKEAILTAYLNRDWDTIATASRLSANAINQWSAGDQAANPDYEEDEGGHWYLDPWLIGSFFFLVIVIIIATKVWGLW